MKDGANNPLKNRYLYQGKEMQDESGMQLYDFHARQYDPQIGRFWGIDPMDQFPSGYTGMGNDPANMVDPTGMVGNGSGASGGYGTGYNPGGGYVPSPFGEGGHSVKSFFADPRFEDMDGLFEQKKSGGGGGGSTQSAQGQSKTNSDKNTKDKNISGGQSSSQSGQWTLMFTGHAEDRTLYGGKIRQIGIGKLSILNKNGAVVDEFDAISGPEGNGLLPNGEYKANKLTLKMQDLLMKPDLVTNCF